MSSCQMDVPVAESVTGGVTEPLGLGDMASESDAVKPDQLDEEEMFEDANDGINDGTNDEMNDGINDENDDKDAKEEGDDEDEEEDNEEDDKEEKEVKQPKREEEDDDEFDPDSIITESAFWHVSTKKSGLPSLCWLASFTFSLMVQLDESSIVTIIHSKV